MTRTPAAATRWTLTIDAWLPPSLNRLLHAHWAKAARIKRAVRDLIAVAAHEAGVPAAAGKRRVSLVLAVTNLSHAPDPDNCWKAVLDGLKRGELIVDDRADWCEMGPVTIEKGSRKRTTIILEDL